MRLQVFAALLLFAGAFIPLPALAQESSTFFKPIVPQGTDLCTCPGSAPDWGCILQVAQNVINVAVGLAIVFVVLAIVYAAFIFMTRGGKPESRRQARNMVTNALIGLAIILCAWLGVNFVMKTVYDPAAVYSGDLKLGPWHSIWTAGPDDLCLRPSDTKPITRGEVEVRLAVLQGTLQGGVGACSPTEFKAAAARGGVTVDDREAAVIACLAGPESRCGANAGVNYCWNKPSSRQCPKGASTAYGPYQILLSTHSAKFETAACYRAAGMTSGRLNCAAGFSRGRPIQTAEGRQIVARCQRAAANMDCSAVVAHHVYQESLRATGDGSKPWARNSDSTAAHRACTVRGQ